MEGREPLRPGVYGGVVRMFEKRVSERDLQHKIDAPYEDNDLVYQARELGLSDDIILEACLLARSRISAQVGIELVNMTEKEIAENDYYIYAPYSSNPNLN